MVRTLTAPPSALHPSVCGRAETVSPAMLDSIVQGLATANAHCVLTVPRGQDRTFVRLLATPSYEAWLIAWNPSVVLGLHDHGGARGVLHVVRGALEETYVDLPGAGRPTTRTLVAGASIDVPESRIHEVRNPGPRRALSIHAYSPPLAAMTFYERDIMAT